MFWEGMKETVFIIFMCVFCSAAVAQERADVSATFSIVAVDIKEGLVGVAVASCYPDVGNVVAYVRAGVGAFCTQHSHNPKWGELALDYLEDGDMPIEVLSKLLENDRNAGQRQLAIIDTEGRSLSHNPTHADHNSNYWGSIVVKNY